MSVKSALFPQNQDEFYTNLTELTFDEAALEDEEGGSQRAYRLLQAPTTIFFYNTASYNFSPMYYHFRGHAQPHAERISQRCQDERPCPRQFQLLYPAGSFSSRGFRNKTTTIGTEASNYGFGDIGGSVNYNTVTDLYAPGFNGSVAFTNSNYMLRAIASYATGLSKSGWALTVNGIVRYAKEGVMKGTFYNSAGLFLSLEKRFNSQHSLVLTAFGGPTQRATGRPVVQEAYDLADDNLYNPRLGLSERQETQRTHHRDFRPHSDAQLVFKKENTTLNTALMFRSAYYNRTALNYYNANDPNPSYYKYLPSLLHPSGQRRRSRTLHRTVEERRIVPSDQMGRALRRELPQQRTERLPARIAEKRARRTSWRTASTTSS